MTAIFDGTPVYDGRKGDCARVTHIEGRVLIRAVDRVAEEAVTIAMTPEQAETFAEAIARTAFEASKDADADDTNA